MSLTEHHYQGLDWSCESIDKRCKSIESERDRLTLLLKEQEMHVLERGKEIDRLKAELESTHKISMRNLELREQTAEDRDLWKQKAEKLVEALKRIERKCHTGKDPHDSIQAIVGRFNNIWKVAKQALEEFGEGK